MNMARPTKLTPEVEKAVCDAIREGMTYQAAADVSGIAISTLNDWLKDPRPRFVQFSEAVRRANGEAKKELLRRIRDASRKDWRAAAWILERRFADEYMPRNQTDVTSGGQRIVVRIVPDDELPTN